MTGAHVQDNEPAGAGAALVRLRAAADAQAARLRQCARLGVVYADGIYRGSADLFARLCGLALVRVERTAGAGTGFERLPKRWVVERTFGWLLGCRRLEFDHEYKVVNSEAMIWVRAIQLMLNRIWPTKVAS